MVSLDPSTGIFTASPIHLGFRLHVNKSYSALAATPGQLDAFISSTRGALAIAFKGPITLGRDAVHAASSETEVYIRSVLPSAWPNAAQGTYLLHIFPRAFIECPYSLSQIHIPTVFTPCIASPPYPLCPSDDCFAGKGTDYVTVDFDICLSANIYDSTALQQLEEFWWGLCRARVYLFVFV